jgi:hypothetical protein
MPELPNDQEIVNALTSSGFLLEQEVALVLEQRGYEIRLSPSYVDPDEGKQREIDVIAYKDTSTSSVPDRPLCHFIVVECKSTPQVHVAFAREWTVHEREVAPFEVRLETLNGGARRKDPRVSVAWEDAQLDAEWAINRLNVIEKGVQLIRIERKGAKFEARNVLPEMCLPPIKAAYGLKTEVMSGRSGRDGILFPVCVMGGSLKIGRVGASNGLLLEESDFIVMQYENRSDWMKARGYATNYVDIVPIGSLDRWIQHVENVMGRINLRARSYANR